MKKSNITKAKPFVKWAGGKTQLLPVINEKLPKELTPIGEEKGDITRYVEPFVGSGAVLFHVLQNYNIDEAYIFDINPELILVYRVIKEKVDDLIASLKTMEEKYLPLDSEGRKEVYYNQRYAFNEKVSSFDFEKLDKESVERAAQFIFLNRTCFNGLFRVNKSGEFNVPMGSYKNPAICNPENLIEVNKLLQKIKIFNKDYKYSEKFITNETFVYFDPPYRPISTSSSFTSYSKYDFQDEQQIELADFFNKVDKEIGAKLMLSNSNPKHTNPDDDFFEKLYEGFVIEQVSARRNINSKSSGRGSITELLIRNYD